jgi:hypothetical protein
MLSEKLTLKWKKPNPEKEHSEVKYQLKKGCKPGETLTGCPDWVKKRLKKLRDKKKWKAALKAGIEKHFGREHIKKIGWFGPRGNTGETWKQILHKKYFDQSAGEHFKHVNTPYKIKEKMKAGKGLRKPVVLHNPKTGAHWLIGGHHRMSYVSTKLKKPVAAHVIEDTK